MDKINTIKNVNKISKVLLLSSLVLSTLFAVLSLRMIKSIPKKIVNKIYVTIRSVIVNMLVMSIRVAANEQGLLHVWNLYPVCRAADDIFV
jgi:hypothetical protein